MSRAHVQDIQGIYKSGRTQRLNVFHGVSAGAPLVKEVQEAWRDPRIRDPGGGGTGVPVSSDRSGEGRGKQQRS